MNVKWVRVIAFAWLFLTPSFSHAETSKEVLLLVDPGLTDNRLCLLSPIEAGPYQLRGPYGEKWTPARWILLTDGIGADHQFRLTIDNLGDPSDGIWRIDNNSTSGEVIVGRRGGRTSLVLSQDSSDDTKYGCDEVDLFVMAIAPVVPESGVIPFSEQPSLAEMTALKFTWKESLLAREIGQRCAAGRDAALTMGSVYFKNIFTDQTLQYQIVTSDARSLLPVGSYYVNLPAGEFVGVADNSATVYGLPYLKPNARKRVVQIDILSRVLAVLAAIPNANVDKDPHHWYTLMTSNGSYVNGSAEIISTVSDINLVAVVP